MKTELIKIDREELHPSVRIMYRKEIVVSCLLERRPMLSGVHWTPVYHVLVQGTHKFDSWEFDPEQHTWVKV